MGRDLSRGTELKGGPQNACILTPGPWFSCSPSKLISYIFYLLPLSITYLHTFFFFSHFPLLFFSCFSPFMLLPALGWYGLDTHSRKGTKVEGYPHLGWTGQRSGCPSSTLSFKKKKREKKKETAGSEEASSGHLVITNIKLWIVQLLWSHQCGYHYSQTVRRRGRLSCPQIAEFRTR